MKASLLAVALIALTVMSIAAQESYSVGEEVEVYCACLGPMAWTAGRVEQIDGSKLKVRYGNGKYQFTTVQNSPSAIRRRGQGIVNADDVRRRNDFIREASPFRNSVIVFSPFFDAKFKELKLVPLNEMKKTMDDLTALDALCRSKYQSLKNDPNSPWPNDINYQPATWCAIASERARLEGPWRERTAANYLRVFLTKVDDALAYALKNKDNRTPDDAADVLFARQKWEKEQTDFFRPKFAEYGAPMPSDFLAPTEKKADELRRTIDRTAPERPWTPPPYRDAAVETFVRSKYAADADYRGVKILKIGLDYASWVKRESLSYVGSDSNFRYYKVEYNEYKRGWALMKLPGQPYCQAREWIVGRQAGKTVVVSLGGSGIFMKCE